MGKHHYDPAFDGLRKIQQAATMSAQSYTGEMLISPAPYDGHAVTWKTTAGNYDGIGLVIEGRLWIAFGKDKTCGLAVYSEGDGIIEAHFTSYAFKGAAGKEKVLGCAGFGHLNRTYETQGRQPDNISYTGKIAFAEYGPLFLITWAFHGEAGQLNGVGMIRHGKLVTGYGFPGDYSFGCGCYELLPDGGIRGEWAIPSFQKTTTEFYGKPQWDKA